MVGWRRVQIAVTGLPTLVRAKAKITGRPSGPKRASACRHRAHRRSGPRPGEARDAAGRRSRWSRSCSRAAPGRRQGTRRQPTTSRSPRPRSRRPVSNRTRAWRSCSYREASSCRRRRGQGGEGGHHRQDVGAAGDRMGRRRDEKRSSTRARGGHSSGTFRTDTAAVSRALDHSRARREDAPALILDWFKPAASRCSSTSTP